jgi:hypothetical protein
VGRKAKLQTKQTAPPPKEEVSELMTEKELAAHLHVSPHTLRDWRGDTPKNWTVERMKEAAARGETIHPPFLKLGTKKTSPVRYVVKEVNIWLSLQPHWGQLPEAVNF